MKTDPITSFPGGSWDQPSRRMRDLQRLQVALLVVIGAASVVLIGLLGRNLLRSADHQTRASDQLTALMEIRDTMIEEEALIWRSRAEGTRLPFETFAAAYGRFRSEALRLADEHAGGDGADVMAARERVLSAVRTIDTISARLVTSGLDAGGIDAALRATDAPAADLRSGMRQWIDAAATSIRDANVGARDQSRRLVWSLIALAAFILASGVALWFLLDRVRARLVAALSRSEERFRSLVQHSSDAVLVADPDGRIRYASYAAERLFDRSPDELVGRHVGELAHPDDTSPMSSLDADDLATLASGTSINWTVGRSDGSRAFLETVATDRTDDETIQGFVLNSRDVSDRRQIEMALEHRAFHDALTDLANRALFVDRVDHALTLLRREQRLIAVLLIDLDDFKTVNDSLGHAAGDGLLVEVARRLRSALREHDTPARLGGDEFAVLIESCHNRSEVLALAERLVGVIREPMQVEGHTLGTRASIGCAITDAPDVRAERMLRNADVAMYAAKSRGGSRVSLFDPAMDRQAGERLSMISDLDRAVADDELFLEFQPAIALRSERLAAVEALVRWRHPTRGVIAPGAFIHLAEETGQIVGVGARVLDLALQQVADWNSRFAQAASIRVAVNVSVRQLEDPQFTTTVADSLRRHGVPASQLVLEITEHALARDHERVAAHLDALKRIGLAIAIDDFGTGYSSLSYLARLPIDIVKIDRAFVADLTRGRRTSRLAETVVRIGQSLHLVTVAEGVEEPLQLDILRSLGCRLAQGFLLSRPVPGEELEPTIASGEIRPSQTSVD